MDDIKIPKSSYVEMRQGQKNNNPKSQLEIVFDEYKELLKDKTHPDNQTKIYNERVKTTLMRLLSAADKLDETNPGEGIFGLIVLSLRANLSLKDQIIVLQADLDKAKKEINRLKKQ